MLLVLLYLGLFSIYRFWDVGLGVYQPTDVKRFYFGILTDLLHNLGDPRSGEIYNAITAKYVVVWGYATGIVGLALFIAIAISGYVIFKALRDWSTPKKLIFTGCILLFCLVIYTYFTRQLGIFDNFTVIPRQFWGLIHFQLRSHRGMPHIVNVEMFIVATAYAVSTLLGFAGAATLWPVRELQSSATPKNIDVENGAKYLALQMKHLRLLLYVGAILLVVITFRHRMTLNWALEYLKPVPLLESYPTYKYVNLIYGHLETLTSNIVLATSVLNTLLLAALYVPEALLLQRRAHALSRIAASKESKSGESAWEDEWLKSRHLIFPFKEQLPKVIAILSPLLAGPLGEVLNFFR
ncbi:MAG TPA: hypothetical protein VNO50_20900 [Pyrinomonadaceae bacterium]|nr:hypothetical protein [Pyrinomonadaceae bacterium]